MTSVLIMANTSSLSVPSVIHKLRASLYGAQRLLGNTRTGWLVIANDKGGVIHSGAIGLRQVNLASKQKKAFSQLRELDHFRVLYPRNQMAGAIRTINLKRNLILSLCTDLDDPEIDFAIVLRTAVTLKGLTESSASAIASVVKPSGTYKKLAAEKI